MPTPLEILMNPISLAVIAIYATLFLWESLFPGRKLPRVPFWILRGLLAFAFYFYLSSYLPLLWDHYLAQYQLMDLTGLGTVTGGLVGVLFYQLAVYG